MKQYTLNKAALLHNESRLLDKRKQKILQNIAGRAKRLRNEFLNFFRCSEQSTISDTATFNVI